MATTNGNRKILDLKRWEFCTPTPTATAAGSFVISSRHHKQQQLFVQSATVHYLYNPSEDGWVQIPSGALAGTFGAGACGTATAVGPSGTCTNAGSSTTEITTSLTLARDLRGYKIYITGGAGAGQLATISSNTVGANSVITVPTLGTAVDNTSTYKLLTPRYYVICAGTLAANIFKYYDYALNTWTAGTQTGLPATISTDSKLIATPSFLGSDFVSFATGTATAGASTTLTNSAKTWTTNQWSNYQVRITAGTGVGQVRTISSNTGTVLTVSSAWTINPSTDSQYCIEGNDDYLYYMGSNAVTMMRYSISANTWTTLSPSSARAAAPGAGMSGHWIYGVTDAAWSNESSISNGRYIYSFRGAAGAVLDRYDIALNTWSSAFSYSPATETFTTGTKYNYDGKDTIYIQKDATGRWFDFSVPERSMDGWGTTLYTQGAAVVGDTCFDASYKDGATEIQYVYMVLNTSTVLLRQMVI
jgi:hypothetical protein